MKKKGKSTLVTVVVNILLIAAIAVVGWKIYDYINDTNQTAKLAEDLWTQAAVTAAPSAGTADQGTAAKETETPAAESVPETETGSGTADASAQTELQSAQPVPEETSAKTATEKPVPEKTAAEKATETPAPEETPTEKTTEKPTPKDTTAEKAAETTEEPIPEETVEVLTEEDEPAQATPAPTATATPRFTDAPDVPVQVDFDVLKETNKETAAWLYHPDLEINLPVVHTDNNSFYLKHGFDGFREDSGTLFIDCRNKGDFSDLNTVIYGHARKDRHMFGNLQNYKDAEFCKDHPFFYLFIDGHRFRLEIVAAGDTTDASPFYSFPVDDTWLEQLQKIMEKSPYDFGIPITPEDHYVTLSTCAYDYEDERWLIIARIDDPEGVLPFYTEEEP